MLENRWRMSQCWISYLSSGLVQLKYRSVLSVAPQMASFALAKHIQLNNKTKKKLTTVILFSEISLIANHVHWNSHCTTGSRDSTKFDSSSFFGCSWRGKHKKRKFHNLFALSFQFQIDCCFIKASFEANIQNE